jgi:GNAT superfamily N-acetyltransferase
MQFKRQPGQDCHEPGQPRERGSAGSGDWTWPESPGKHGAQCIRRPGERPRMSTVEQRPHECGSGPLRLCEWDVRSLGIPCYELSDISAEGLQSVRLPGHYTVKINPLADKSLLHEHGFYYCDTLMEPYCRPGMFTPVFNPAVTRLKPCDLGDLLDLSRGAYRHGRFHRDFNIPDTLADLRYDNWIRDLHGAGTYFGLCYDGELAAYFGVNRSKVVLHAVAEKYRGRGLARFLWSTGYCSLFDEGYDEVTSSVSASNSAVLNLYASLGFRFRNPVDVYHRLIASDD